MTRERLERDIMWKMVTEDGERRSNYTCLILGGVAELRTEDRWNTWL